MVKKLVEQANGHVYAWIQIIVQVAIAAAVVGYLQSSVSALDQSFTKLDNTVETIRDDMRALLISRSGSEKQMDHIEDALERIETKLSDHEERIRGLER